MTWLPDGNILVALVLTDHSDHARVLTWFQGSTMTEFATCSVTQGTLLRLYLRLSTAATPTGAWRILEQLEKDARHVFWNDGFSYLEISSKNLQGQRQVTDAWLAELARRHGAKLATMDKGLAQAHSDVAVLIP